MLNGQWLNAGPLNSSGVGSAQVALGVTGAASASITAPTLQVRRSLGATATATGAFEPTSLTRRRGLATGATATAEFFAGMSVEIGGVVHAYLDAIATATATMDPPALACLCPLAAMLDAGAVVSVTTGIRRALRVSGSATASVDTPFLYAAVNLGGFLPGQDSIIGTQRIRAFGFATASLRRRRLLAANGTAVATMLPRPRLQMQVRFAVVATAGTGRAEAALYRRRQFAVDAAATATIDAATLFSFVRLTAGLTATATLLPAIYLNIFDQAPITRTVFVRYQPRVAVPTRIRRVVDA